MRLLISILGVLLSFVGNVSAEVEPVSLSVAKAEAWTGERVSVTIELRARGSFSGSASFDLPEIPGALLMKVGNPVVGSKEIEGESWFVQTHGFSLFSQKAGTLTIPSFPVRFQARDDFTGPVQDITAKTKEVSFEIKRPPGSEAVPFLVTTSEYTVEETWDPVPGEKAKVGDVFRRTVVQRAEELTGMALLPTSIDAPEGVRVYPRQVETKDNTERGAFDGERRETLTYLLQKDGTVILPELTYTWWEPESEALKSKTLPAVTIDVAPAAVVLPGGSAGTSRWWWPVLLLAGLVALGLWQRVRIAAALNRFRLFLNPPRKVAARKLSAACRRSDVMAAQAAWSQWLAAVGCDVEIDSELKFAIVEMQRVNFGREVQEKWDGAKLSAAFKSYTSSRNEFSANLLNSSLPPLNNPAINTK